MGEQAKANGQQIQTLMGNVGKLQNDLLSKCGGMPDKMTDSVKTSTDIITVNGVLNKAINIMLQSKTTTVITETENYVSTLAQINENDQLKKKWLNVQKLISDKNELNKNLNDFCGKKMTDPQSAGALDTAEIQKAIDGINEGVTELTGLVTGIEEETIINKTLKEFYTNYAENISDLVTLILAKGKSWNLPTEGEEGSHPIT